MKSMLPIISVFIATVFCSCNWLSSAKQKEPEKPFDSSLLGEMDLETEGENFSLAAAKYNIELKTAKEAYLEYSKTINASEELFLKPEHADRVITEISKKYHITKQTFAAMLVDYTNLTREGCDLGDLQDASGYGQ